MTTIVLVGDDDDDAIVSSIVTAAALGPVIAVFAQERPPPTVASHGQRVDTIQAGEPGLRRRITTHSVMIVSAGSVPDIDSCSEAAAGLTEDVGWITGRAVDLSDSPATRCLRLVRENHRARIRHNGGAIWEADATILRSDLLADIAPSSSTVLGDWLRRGARRGFRGVDSSRALTHRVGTVDGNRGWNHQTHRDQANAAELHRALTAGPMRARRAEIVALLNQLIAWPLLAWGLVPLIVVGLGRFPLRIPAWTFWVSAVGLGALRWLADRLAHSLTLHPLGDIGGAFIDAPGSLAATAAAASGRIPRRRLPRPAQPILVAAAAASLATTMAFIASRPPESRLVVPVAVSLAQLALVWIFAARNIAVGEWSRASHRIHPYWGGGIGSAPVQILDASTHGIAARIDGPGPSVGDTITVSISLPSRTEVHAQGTVIHKKERAGSTVLGLTLQLEAEQQRTWIRHLVNDARTGNGGPHRRGSHVENAHRARRAPLAYLSIVALGSAALLAMVILAMLGLDLRPVTISGQSMYPSLMSGDLAIEEPVSVAAIHVGDIVTLNAGPSGMSLTHRVRGISINMTTVTLETRGDANRASEEFVLSRRTVLHKVVHRVPELGGVLSVIGGRTGRWTADGLAASLIGIATIRWLRTRSHAARHEDAHSPA